MKLSIIIACILLITTANASTSNNRGVRRLQQDQRRISKAGKGSKAALPKDPMAGIELMVDEDEIGALNSLGFVVDGNSLSISMSMYEPAAIDSRRRLSKGSKSSATLTTRPTTVTGPTTVAKASKASSKAMKIQTTSTVVPTTVTAGGSETGVAGGLPALIQASAIDIDIEEMSMSMPMFVPAEELTDVKLLSIDQDENSLSMSMLMVEEK